MNKDDASWAELGKAFWGLVTSLFKLAGIVAVYFLLAWAIVWSLNVLGVGVAVTFQTVTAVATLTMVFVMIVGRITQKAKVNV